MAQTTQWLDDEKKRSDALLYRMLPADIAADLREGRKVDGITYPEVTILFRCGAVLMCTSPVPLLLLEGQPGPGTSLGRRACLNLQPAGVNGRRSELAAAPHAPPPRLPPCSDIVGFTVTSAKSTAEEVYNMLNGMYDRFDAVVDQFPDIYKLETIGE